MAMDASGTPPDSGDVPAIGEEPEEAPPPAAVADDEVPAAEATVAAVVPVGRHEEIDGICGRIDAAPTLAVVLHAPAGNRALAGELAMRRVARHARARGRTLAIATRSGALARRARRQGLPVAATPGGVHWGAGGKAVLRLGGTTLLLPPVERYAPRAVVGLLALAALVILFTVAPAATVTVYPPAQRVERLVVARASPRVEAPDLETLTLPAEAVSAQRTILLAVPTTGMAARGVSAATATLVVSNPTGEAVAVPAGSIVFALPAFVSFALDEAVTVPAGGETRIAATSIAAGEAGNVAANAITQWRNQSFLALDVTNPEAASGGADGDARAVAAADLRALEALAEDLAGDVSLAALLAEARPGHAVIARSVAATVDLGAPSAAEGEAAAAVFAEARVAVRALAIPPAALEALARSVLDAPEGLGPLVPGTVVAVETGRAQRDHADGSRTSELRLSAAFPDAPTPAEVEDAVRGRRIGSAEAELRSRYGSDDVEIGLSPGWAPWLPRFGARIDVVYAVRPPEPAPDGEAADGP